MVRPIFTVIKYKGFFIIFSNPSAVHGARISGLEARVTIVEDRICDLDARGSEESDNITNERDLDRFIMTGDVNMSIYRTDIDCSLFICFEFYI